MAIKCKYSINENQPFEKVYFVQPKNKTTSSPVAETFFVKNVINPYIRLTYTADDGCRAQIISFYVFHFDGLIPKQTFYAHSVYENGEYLPIPKTEITKTEYYSLTDTVDDYIPNSIDSETVDLRLFYPGQE